MSTCRSCHAAILWAVTPQGNRMPLDAEPAADGNVELDETQTPPVAHVMSQPSLVPVERYMPHHATCPQADQWRRR